MQYPCPFHEGGMAVGRKWIIALAAVLMLLGLGVLLYPTVSSAVNRMNGSYAIQEFQEQLDGMDEALRETELAEARIYNEKLKSVTDRTDETVDPDYESILDFGNGIMGFISIPKISVKLPIYHGVSTEVLEKGVGHLPSSSFPIAGEGNHAVLTGHTGLPSASLFTDLNQIGEGDRFEVSIGGETALYLVDQIKVVLPNETGDLSLTAGEDYCTLVTCTPYGVNSHRLLVRGSRVEMLEEEPVFYVEQAENGGKERNWFKVILSIPIIGIIFFIRRKRGKRHG